MPDFPSICHKVTKQSRPPERSDSIADMGGGGEEAETVEGKKLKKMQESFLRFHLICEPHKVCFKTLCSSCIRRSLLSVTKWWKVEVWYVTGLLSLQGKRQGTFDH